MRWTHAVAQERLKCWGQRAMRYQPDERSRRVLNARWDNRSNHALGDKQAQTTGGPSRRERKRPKPDASYQERDAEVK